MSCSFYPQDPFVSFVHLRYSSSSPRASAKCSSIFTLVITRSGIFTLSLSHTHTHAHSSVTHLRKKDLTMILSQGSSSPSSSSSPLTTSYSRSFFFCFVFKCSCPHPASAFFCLNLYLKGLPSRTFQRTSSTLLIILPKRMYTSAYLVRRNEFKSPGFLIISSALQQREVNGE